jgi:ABC-type branched-subunit amino acid transport system substrate-binding protein
LIKALDTDEPTPSKLQETLSTPGFEAPGASKLVKFSRGDRDQEDVELAKIVRSKCSEFGYIFVPEKYSPDDIKKLEKENSCNQ